MATEIKTFDGFDKNEGSLKIMRAHRGRVLDEKLGPAHLVLVGVHLNAPDVMLAFK